MGCSDGWDGYQSEYRPCSSQRWLNQLIKTNLHAKLSANSVCIALCAGNRWVACVRTRYDRIINERFTYLPNICWIAKTTRYVDDSVSYVPGLFQRLLIHFRHLTLLNEYTLKKITQPLIFSHTCTVPCKGCTFIAEHNHSTEMDSKQTLLTRAY
jgi:hypothetical protein